MPFAANGTWINWTAGFVHITNTTDPVTAIVNTVSNQLPWFWPVVPFILYMYLVIVYNNAPQRWKFVGISALVLVITAFMALAFNNVDAIANVIIFGVALLLSNMFKG